MAFVKDGNFEGFKRDVASNHDALEERVIDLERQVKELTKNTIGVPVDEIVPEPEPEVVEEEVVEEPEVEDEEETSEEEEEIKDEKESKGKKKTK